MDYSEFLRGKIVLAPESGFDLENEDIHPILKPYERDSVKWMVKGGKRAPTLFEMLDKELD
jgi:hypothetical protein